MITNIVWTDNNKLLQESYLTARRQRRAPHRVIGYITFNYQRLLAREGLVNLTGDHTVHELRSASTKVPRCIASFFIELEFNIWDFRWEESRCNDDLSSQSQLLTVFAQWSVCRTWRFKRTIRWKTRSSGAWRTTICFIWSAAPPIPVRPFA